MILYYFERHYVPMIWNVIQVTLILMTAIEVPLLMISVSFFSCPQRKNKFPVVAEQEKKKATAKYETDIMKSLNQTDKLKLINSPMILHDFEKHYFAVIWNAT